MTTNNDDGESVTESLSEKSDHGPRPSARSKNQRANLAGLALALAVAALALSAWAAFRPTEVAGSADSQVNSVPAEFTTEQRDAAKVRACDAFTVVRKGVALNTNSGAPGGPEDLTGGIAVAANARLSLLGGGQYLLSRIDPAAPDELANESRELAAALMEIGATAVSGVPTSDPAQLDRMKRAQDLSIAVAAKCGQA